MIDPQAAPAKKHWIAQVEIEAECVLPEDAPPLTYVDPRGKYTARLVNRAVRPLVEKPLLEMQLEFDAPDLAVAHEKVKPLARQYLYWLSLVTQCAFRVSRVERVIDWTPGLTMREQYIYHADRSDMPQRALVPELANTLALFNTEDSSPEVRRAIRWFANGIAADLLDDQFQCFFFAIEILAEFHKSPERVPDLCPTCRGELFCASCNQVPTHRPYAKQAIEKLMTRFVPDGGLEAFKVLDTVRNHVMHGRQVDEIEAALPLAFDEIVDRTGRIAWVCIMNSLRLPAGTHQPMMMQATTFVRRTLTVKAHVHMGSKGGDPNHPRLEDQGTLNISVTRPTGKDEAGQQP